MFLQHLTKTKPWLSTRAQKEESVAVKRVFVCDFDLRVLLSL